MCRSRPMVDIQSATAEIRRWIKKKKKELKKPQDKNIMSASATQGGHNKRIHASRADEVAGELSYRFTDLNSARLHRTHKSLSFVIIKGWNGLILGAYTIVKLCNFRYGGWIRIFPFPLFPSTRKSSLEVAPTTLAQRTRQTTKNTSRRNVIHKTVTSQPASVGEKRSFVNPVTANFDLWPNFELDLDMLRVSQYAKCLGQRLFSTKVSV